MTLYSVDWAHTTDKLIYFNGEKILKKPNFESGDIVCGENIPLRYCKKLFDKDVKIYRVHQNLISEYRESQGVEKTDENDARLIYDYYEKFPDKFKSYIGESALKNLYATFKEVQKVRVATNNRVWISGEDESNEFLLKSMIALEKDIKKQMEKEIIKYPIWNWLHKIRGLEVTTASGLLSYIGDIEKYPYVSHLWAYLGLGVSEGKAPAKRKGEQSNYNMMARSLILGVIGHNFVRGKPQVYREIYDTEKDKQLSREYPEGHLKDNYSGYKKSDTHLSKGHAHNRAIRKMMKIFISHYWLIDRQLHNLPTKPLYVHDKLKHNTYIKPPHIPKSLLPFNPIKK